MTEQIDQQPTGKPKRRGRGFQGMSPERRRAVAQMGGRRAHELGTAHKWSSDEASEAGRKGAAISWDKRRKLSREELRERRERIIRGEI